MENTQPYYETENEILVHAGLLPGVPLQAQKMDDLLWLHNTNPQPHCSGKRVIVGHTTQWNGEVRNCGHTVLIDTFAYGTGWLTALDVELNRCFQANERAQTRQLDL